MVETSTDHLCLRKLVVVYNAIFWVTGPGMIGLGIWLIIALGEYDPVIDRAEFSLPAYIIIAAGGASVLAGLVGCLGGLNMNRRLLYVYSLLMLFVCATEVTATVLCFLAYDLAEGKISTMLNDTVQIHYAEDRVMADSLDSIQSKLDCCGVGSYQDWRSSHFFTTAISSLSLPHAAEGLRQVAPRSCCVKGHNDTGCNLGNDLGTPLHSNLLYQLGCRSALVDWLHQIFIIAGWSVAGVGASMILALSAVCCLKHALSAFYS